MARVDHDRMKKQYGNLYSQVAAILFEADPVGINVGFNTDEYEPEVSTILPRLRECSSAADVQRVLLEEFTRWFSAEVVKPEVSRDQYAGPAAKIWELWQQSPLSGPAM
jgi:hypothetical protein